VASYTPSASVPLNKCNVRYSLYGTNTEYRIDLSAILDEPGIHHCRTICHQVSPFLIPILVPCAKPAEPRFCHSCCLRVTSGYGNTLHLCQVSKSKDVNAFRQWVCHEIDSKCMRFPLIDTHDGPIPDFCHTYTPLVELCFRGLHLGLSSAFSTAAFQPRTACTTSVTFRSAVSAQFPLRFCQFTALSPPFLRSQPTYENGPVAQRLEQGIIIRGAGLRSFSQSCTPLRTLGISGIRDLHRVAHNCTVLQQYFVRP